MKKEIKYLPIYCAEPYYRTGVISLTVAGIVLSGIGVFRGLLKGNNRNMFLQNYDVLKLLSWIWRF